MKTRSDSYFIMRPVLFASWFAVLVAFASTSLAQTNPLAVTGRMTRGTGTNPNFQSFVIPLDFQKGVSLDPMGDNAAKFDGQAPWFSRVAKDTRLQFDEVAGDWLINFENPIGAFGSTAGGTPLYSDQSYSFGFYAGGRVELSAYPDLRYALRISVYRKSDVSNGQTNVAPVSQYEIDIPRRDLPEDALAWAEFAGSGFTKTVTDQYGLKTIVQLVEPGPNPIPWDTGYSSPYVVTHSVTSTDYYDIVECRGFISLQNGSGQINTYPLVYDGTGNFGWSTLYSLNFDTRPAGQSTFIYQPHFEGSPLPPGYQGKSLQELLQTKVMPSPPSGLDPNQFLALTRVRNCGAIRSSISSSVIWAMTRSHWQTTFLTKLA